MNFKSHLELRDKHAFLSPSNYHWLRYDADKLKNVYLAMRRKEEGTRLHALAKELIELGVMLPSTQETLNMYVNDCIVCRLTPEQPLFYSYYCYGTADAIGFDGSTLRVSDLKTGTIKASMEQLKIYAALFFLEYGPSFNVTPDDVEVELRIYQNNQVSVEIPPAHEIREVINQIIFCDEQLNMMEGGRSSWTKEFSDL